MAIIGELKHQIGHPEIAKPPGTPRELMKSLTFTSGPNATRFARWNQEPTQLPSNQWILLATQPGAFLGLMPVVFETGENPPYNAYKNYINLPNPITLDGRTPTELEQAGVNFSANIAYFGSHQYAYSVYLDELRINKPQGTNDSLKHGTNILGTVSGLPAHFSAVFYARPTSGDFITGAETYELWPETNGSTVILKMVNGQFVIENGFNGGDGINITFTGPGPANTSVWFKETASGNNGKTGIGSLYITVWNNMNQVGALNAKVWGNPTDLYNKVFWDRKYPLELFTTGADGRTINYTFPINYVLGTWLAPSGGSETRPRFEARIERVGTSDMLQVRDQTNGGLQITNYYYGYWLIKR